MLISELQVELEKIKQEHGNLLAVIERPTGSFVAVAKLVEYFLVNFDSDGATLKGNKYLVIKPIVN